MVLPVRNLTAGGCDEVRLLWASQGLMIPPLALVGEHGIHSTFLEAPPHAHRGVATDVEGHTHRVQAPSLAQFEQDLGAGAPTGTFLPAVHECLHAGTIDLRQRDDIARVGREHEDLLWSSSACTPCQSRTGLSTMF